MIKWSKLSFPNIICNSEGEIFRICRKHGYECHKGYVGGMQKLKINKDKGGYCQFHFDGKNYKVHRILMEALYGPCPSNQEVDHINRIRDDNRLDNLRYVTRSENMRNTNSSINSLVHDFDYAKKSDANNARNAKRGLYRTKRNGKYCLVSLSERIIK